MRIRILSSRTPLRRQRWQTPCAHRHCADHFQSVDVRRRFVSGRDLMPIAGRAPALDLPIYSRLIPRFTLMESLFGYVRGSSKMSSAGCGILRFRQDRRSFRMPSFDQGWPQAQAELGSLMPVTPSLTDSASKPGRSETLPVKRCYLRLPSDLEESSALLRPKQDHVITTNRGIGLSRRGYTERAMRSIHQVSKIEPTCDGPFLSAWSISKRNGFSRQFEEIRRRSAQSDRLAMFISRATWSQDRASMR